MTDISFYHLQRQPLEAVLPILLDRCVARGWKTLVRVASAERVAALDDRLWTYADESFLPHGTERDADPERQPVLIATGEANPGGAGTLFLVDGARLPDEAGAFERVVLLFDGNDEAALAEAREDWRRAKASGHQATYWKQDASGRWQKA
jgi:DNA polymerase-3 subunit chi